MIVIPGVLGAATPDGGLAGDPLDTLLAARGWRVRSAPAVVMMTADAGQVGGTRRSVGGQPGPEVSGAARAVTFAAQPDKTWLARYHYRGEELPARAVRLLLSAPWQAFASLAVDGETAAVGRVSVAAGWAGITAVDVDPRYRRRGLGTLMTRALAGEAARQGRAPGLPAGGGGQPRRPRPLRALWFCRTAPLPLPGWPGGRHGSWRAAAGAAVACSSRTRAGWRPGPWPRRPSAAAGAPRRRAGFASNSARSAAFIGPPCTPSV